VTSELEVLFRVFLAAILGGAVGFDRQLRRKPAGVRTHMLVAMGSALAVGVSVLVTQDIEGVGRADAVRVAAGVVTGVGFLGAGTILRSPEGVRGLTTAAGLWVTATIGIALGFGYYGIAVGSTVIAVIIISFLVDLPNPNDAAPEDP
jgi:putative Mg2+ transporter-C (MgtC) family protein